jgi:hypothetical protein
LIRATHSSPLLFQPHRHPSSLEAAAAAGLYKPTEIQLYSISTTYSTDQFRNLPYTNDITAKMRFLPTVAIFSTVSAFLLPPTISSKDKETIDTLSFENAIASDRRVMEIACLGCPVDIKDIQGQVNAVTTQVESVLRLNFSITHNEDVDQLLLNGLPIYPQDDPFLHQHMLTADQLVKSEDGTWNYAATPDLGFFLGIRHSATSSDDTQIGLIEIHAQVLHVGAKFIDGIAIAELKLLETPSGKLMIGDARLLLPAKVSASGPTDASLECANIICRWKAILAAKLSELKLPKLPKLKACNGPEHGQAWSSKSGHSRHSARPHDSHRPHRPHRHHHRHGSFSRFIRGVVFHVFIPIFIGIAVGITASLVGMVVGHLAIFLFRVLFRRSQRVTYQKVDQDESKSFIGHQSPPPIYEDAPAYYEEAVCKEKTPL